MPEYATKALESLQNPKPKRPLYAPHRWTVPSYGRQLQTIPAPDESELIDNKTAKKIQLIVGTLLYYAQ